MRRFPTLVLLVSVPLFAACSSDSYLPFGKAPPGAALATTGPTWVSEAQALRDVVALPSLVLVALALAALLLFGRLARTSLRFGWRLGLDPQHRLTSWLGIAQLVLAIAAGVLLVGHFLDAAPGFTLLTLALGAGASILVLGRPLQSLWAGMLLRLRLRLREGDRVSVAGCAGIVRDIGLLRTELLSERGGTVLVPNRIVVQEIVKVEPGRGTATVRVRVPSVTGSFSDAGERLRRIAGLSPYRAPHTPIAVASDDDGKSAWVEIQVWSFDAVRAAERHLTAALLAPIPNGPPPARQHGAESDGRAEKKSSA